MDYVPRTKLRYNYTYINETNNAFKIFKITSSNIEPSILLEVSDEVLKQEGKIVIDFNYPYQVKRILEYTYNTGVFVITSNGIVNTHLITDGVHTKDELLLNYLIVEKLINSLISNHFTVTIDTQGLGIEIQGRITIH
ncbi:MAG: hypothetical protein DRG78_09350 [Epsilonproteobacteria bacterium]|nr:MAG: hypothetical protein DRG78_09350 [Campylobacterota bacterium]